MLLFLKYLISRDSYFHRKLSCVKINITLESSSSGNHSLHRREENSMKENKDKLSADEKKRLEYETRQRAIRDYNMGMLTAERRGIEAGRKIGIEEGRAEGESRINQLNIELSKIGRTEDILKAAVDKEYQRKLLEEFGLY